VNGVDEVLQRLSRSASLAQQAAFQAEDQPFPQAPLFEHDAAAPASSGVRLREI